MSSSQSTTDPSVLAGLSRPKRLQALANSGLVRKWEQGDDVEGIWVDEGEIVPSNKDGWTTPFPDHLLSADGEVGSDAKAVLLGQNRILLDGEMPVSLAFLESMDSDMLKHIRRLDIWFSEPQVSEWKDDDAANAEGWRQLASFVADKLNLAELDLALDAGQAYETYRERGEKENDLPEARAAYEDIVKVLVNVLGGRKPKRFEVYWAVFHDHEAVAEKAVMGENYDTAALGKVPAQRRNPFFPHGAPTKKYEWERGMRL